MGAPEYALFLILLGIKLLFKYFPVIFREDSFEHKVLEP
jgi:hypothetical protein